MKILLRFGIIVFLVPGMVASAWAQGSRNLIRNGDFEKFSGDEPTGWETSNVPRICTVVSPSATAHGGKQAVKLEVKDCFGSKIPGMITQKNVPIGSGSYRMTFYYVMHSSGGDAGYVSMDFKNAEGSTIRMCEQRLPDSKDVFVMFKADFPAPEGATAGDLKVALLPPNNEGSLHLGTSLFVDDMILVPGAAAEEKPANSR